MRGKNRRLIEEMVTKFTTEEIKVINTLENVGTIVKIGTQGWQILAERQRENIYVGCICVCGGQQLE